MERGTKSEWFILNKPIGEPNVKWPYSYPYEIERVVTSDGTTMWFGCETNWKKEKDGEWTKLIVHEEDRNTFIKCEIPIYEKLYMELEK